VLGSCARPARAASAAHPNRLLCLLSLMEDPSVADNRLSGALPGPLC
jgi:hypothetical protein